MNEIINNCKSDSPLNIYLRIVAFIKPFIGLFISSIFLNIVFSTLSTTTIAMIKPVFQVLFKENPTPAASSPVDISFFENIKNSFYNLITYIVSNPTDPTVTLINLAVLIIALFLIKNLFKYWLSVVAVTLEESVVKSIRDKVFGNMISLSVDFFVKQKEGSLISIITNDINTVNGTTIGSISSILRESIQVILFFFLLITISPSLTFIAFSTSIVSLFILRFAQRFLRRYAARMQLAMADYTTALQETISGIRVVKAYTAERNAFKRFAEQTSKYVRSSIKHQKIITIIPAINEIFAIIALSVVLFVGGSQVIAGSMQAGDLMLFLFSLFAVMAPITAIVNSISQFQRGIVAGERVFKIIDQKTTVDEGTQEISNFDDSIEFKNVNFSYIDTQVIDDVSIKIEKSQKIAFVGASGSGKSTMLDLLVRFYDPVSGEILIDNKNIRNFRISSYRSLFGVVSQETMLFNDTIANNIRYGMESATDSDIIEAAKTANAYNFIMSMQNGFDTYIGDRGVMLSGGERQRISIARALIRNPKILVFDEATSSLDSESEKIVQEAIYKSLESHTAIIVAHRLATIIDCDEIFVFDKGRIAEHGSHYQLLNIDGVYKKLYDIQFINK